MEYERQLKKKTKEMTEEQALQRLSALCAKGEHCTYEMEEKLRKWQIDEAAQARIMAFLTEKKFIDDTRYCEAFIQDKLKYNGWGRRKIAQALYLKHIDSSISEPLLDEIADDLYMEKLRPLVEKKWKSIKARNDYERTMKLIQYAMGRGFDTDLIRKCIQEMGEKTDEDADC